jgi:hypothetical protein
MEVSIRGAHSILMKVVSEQRRCGRKRHTTLIRGNSGDVAGISVSAHTQGAGDPLQVDMPTAMVQPGVRERHHEGAPLDRCHPHTLELKVP